MRCPISGRLLEMNALCRCFLALLALLSFVPFALAGIAESDSESSKPKVDRVIILGVDGGDGRT
ncbi:MAG: hypothetical protein OSB10_03495, partial [Planctomycetota bacterium]|nr:hypothetical protein [Planctomycetota bacterium]